MRVYDYILVFLIIYIICSIVEYAVHKYVMHLPFPYLIYIYQSHVHHHNNAAASSDLSLREDDLQEYDDNLCIPVDKTFYMYILALFISYFILLLYPKKVPLLYTGSCVLFITLFAVLMWNTYHPVIHGLDGKKICGIYSIPSKYINVNSTYSQYVINNHKAHHYYKHNEKGNFNITLPFADFLFGSYKTIPN